MRRWGEPIELPAGYGYYFRTAYLKLTWADYGEGHGGRIYAKKIKATGDSEWVGVSGLAPKKEPDEWQMGFFRIPPFFFDPDDVESAHLQLGYKSDSELAVRSDD